MSQVAYTYTEVAAALGIGGAGAGLGLHHLVQQIPEGAQGWTVMGLLVFVVAGIGTWMVKSIDKTTAAIERNSGVQADVSKALALLTQEEIHARHSTEQKRVEIMAKLASLPVEVARELSSRKT